VPNEKWPSALPPPDAPGGAPLGTGGRPERWLPLGAAAVVGIFKNCYGDANALVRCS